MGVWVEGNNYEEDDRNRERKKSITEGQTKKKTAEDRVGKRSADFQCTVSQPL
jgi:hypothetical protein